MYDLAMALLNGESGYGGFQYLAIGTGDTTWDNLPQPPEAAPNATGLFPYANPAQIERIQFLNAPTGGTFRLGFMGENTSILSFDPDASGTVKAVIIQAALEGLSTIGIGNVFVQAEGGESYLATFSGSLGSGPRDLIVADSSLLTGSNSPQISVTAVNNPAINIVGEFARFPIDTKIYIDENGVPLPTTPNIVISRYCQLSVTIGEGVMTPANSSADPIVFREMAWVGGIGATPTIGSGMYLSIIRFPKQIRRYGDGQITISSNIKI